MKMIHFSNNERGCCYNRAEAVGSGGMGRSLLPSVRSGEPPSTSIAPTSLDWARKSTSSFIHTFATDS